MVHIFNGVWTSSSIYVRYKYDARIRLLVDLLVGLQNVLKHFMVSLTTNYHCPYYTSRTFLWLIVLGLNIVLQIRESTDRVRYSNRIR